MDFENQTDYNIHIDNQLTPNKKKLSYFEVQLQVLKLNTGFNIYQSSSSSSSKGLNSQTSSR